MKKIYLDNAATTPLRQEVIDSMVAVLQNDFGNPSSTHSFGQNAKGLIETSRKLIAKILGANSREIIFTSNATEATNLILTSAVRDLGIKRIITSKIEHHATLYTVNFLQNQYNIIVDYIAVLPTGAINYAHLEQLLQQDDVPTLVSLMHVNNEIGTELNLIEIGTLCHKNKALFHCDTVQSIGKVDFDFEQLPIDFAVASAHKFHGPKGVGFAYINKKHSLKPLLYGGEQEKGLRAGTEAVHQIVGMAKALELAINNLVNETQIIINLKNYCLAQMQRYIPDLKINGEDSFYTVLNVLLPFSEEKTAMILFNLDIKGIAVSRGSACQSGSQKPSHVLQEILTNSDINKPSLRISFSHYNTKEEIDYFIENLLDV